MIRVMCTQHSPNFAALCELLPVCSPRDHRAGRCRATSAQTLQNQRHGEPVFVDCQHTFGCFSTALVYFSRVVLLYVLFVLPSRTVHRRHHVEEHSQAALKSSCKKLTEEAQKNARYSECSFSVNGLHAGNNILKRLSTIDSITSNLSRT